MPFAWTLNPYRGCTHGCHYCFARRYHAQFEMDAGDEFASVILVKQNIADVLARELDRPSWTRELVAFGTATDPYQPIEGHYKLSRAAIQALTLGRTPFGLITKGPMVVRDSVMYLQDGTRDHFMRFIEREFPLMRPRFEKLYTKKSPPDTYRKEVQAMVGVLQARYGLQARREANAEHAPTAAADEAEQVAFAW